MNCTSILSGLQHNLQLFGGRSDAALIQADIQVLLFGFCFVLETCQRLLTIERKLSQLTSSVTWDLLPWCSPKPTPSQEISG